MRRAALWGDERFAGKLGLFGGVDKARFRRQVDPGDTVELVVRDGPPVGPGRQGQGPGVVDGQLACEADLFFVIADA